MDALDAIFTRKSTRSYLPAEVSEEDIRTVLRAGMSGPSAVNARPWSFVVVKDRETLKKMAEANVRYAKPLEGAAFAVLLCGDLERAIPAAPDFWVIDGAIAGQNMALAAHAIGLGCVWLGVYPVAERVENQKKLFELPAHIVPHSILAFGVPAAADFPERDLYDETRIHREQW